MPAATKTATTGRPLSTKQIEALRALNKSGAIEKADVDGRSRRTYEVLVQRAMVKETKAKYAITASGRKALKSIVG